MNNLFRLIGLIGIFALWGQARAYEVVLDFTVQQDSLLNLNQKNELILQAEPILTGNAWIQTQNEKFPVDLKSLKLTAPKKLKTDAQDWAMTWISEVFPEVINDLSHGLDLEQTETELALRKQKLKCRGQKEVKCRAEISVRLTLRRS